MSNLDETLKELSLYFKSGNDVPVERANIPRHLFEQLVVDVENGLLKEYAQGWSDALARRGV